MPVKTTPCRDCGESHRPLTLVDRDWLIAAYAVARPDLEIAYPDTDAGYLRLFLEARNYFREHPAPHVDEIVGRCRQPELVARQRDARTRWPAVGVLGNLDQREGNDVADNIQVNELSSRGVQLHEPSTDIAGGDDGLVREHVVSGIVRPAEDAGCAAVDPEDQDEARREARGEGDVGHSAISSQADLERRGWDPNGPAVQIVDGMLVVNSPECVVRCDRIDVPERPGFEIIERSVDGTATVARITGEFGA